MKKGDKKIVECWGGGRSLWTVFGACGVPVKCEMFENSRAKRFDMGETTPCLDSEVVSRAMLVGCYTWTGLEVCPKPIPDDG